MSEEIRKEKLRAPISKKELERRWKAVRGEMAKEKIDCLIMENSGKYMGGYIRYFTDFAGSAYHSSLVFPLEHDMTIIAHGGAPMALGPPDWGLFGVKERINLPYIPSFNFTNSMAPNAAVNTIKKLNLKSVGIVGMSMMSAFYYEFLKENLPGVVIRDATNLVDDIKAVKSEEEIELLKKTAKMQDIAFGATLAMIRPGVREYEIMSEIKRVVTNLGSEQQLIMIGSAPAGTPSGITNDFLQNRTLKDGDCITIMIECSGAGGYWCELARTICIGDAPKAIRDAWDAAVTAQAKSAEALRPGAKPKDLFEYNNKILTSMGYPPETRVSSHGQGYDVVERPGIRPEETMPIKANMVISSHPIILSKEAFAYCNDDFLVTDSETVRIHEFPQKVYVV